MAIGKPELSTGAIGGGPRGGFPSGGAARGTGRMRTGGTRTVTRNATKVKPNVKGKTVTRKKIVNADAVKKTSIGRKYYHGTKAELKPGTTLKSGKKFGASATTRKSVAGEYATKRLSLLSDKNAKPRVYEVRTRGKLTGPQGKGKPGVGKSITGEVNSNKPFRVVREVKIAKKPTNKIRKNARARYM